MKTLFLIMMVMASFSTILCIFAGILKRPLSYKDWYFIAMSSATNTLLIFLLYKGGVL